MMTCFVDDRIGIAELAVNEFHFFPGKAIPPVLLSIHNY